MATSLFPFGTSLAYYERMNFTCGFVNTTIAQFSESVCCSSVFTYAHSSISHLDDNTIQPMRIRQRMALLQTLLSGTTRYVYCWSCSNFATVFFFQ